MKIPVLISLLLLTSFMVMAGPPPEAVTSAFNKKFPTVTKPKWEKENTNEWEAAFMIGDKKASASFSGDGQWLETEVEIDPSHLPQSVSAAIKKANPDATIIESARIMNSKSEILYEADLKTGSKRTEVIYKEDGTFVK